MKIKNWRTGDVIFEAEADSIKELVELAVKSGVSLKRADLKYANLGHADLKGADLTGANLVCTYFGYADLRGTKFTDAFLYGANTKEAILGEWDERSII